LPYPCTNELTYFSESGQLSDDMAVAACSAVAGGGSGAASFRSGAFALADFLVMSIILGLVAGTGNAEITSTMLVSNEILS
jgi:hypothetical protein